MAVIKITFRTRFKSCSYVAHLHEQGLALLRLTSYLDNLISN
jgi:hypothetical protein